MKRRRDSDAVGESVAKRRQEWVRRYSRKYNPNKMMFKPSRVGSRVRLVAPESISFFGENYKIFLGFINNLRFFSRDSNVLLDLSGVKEIKISAMLMLYSTIEMIQIDRKSTKVVKTTRCQNLKVTYAFYLLGFWELTRESRLRPSPKIHIPHLPICTASYADKKSGEELASLKEVLLYAKKAIESSSLDEELAALANNAITESVSNVWQHAYDDEFFTKKLEDAQKNWWIAVQQIGDQFFIAVYDLGAGIPRTTQSKDWYAKMAEELYAFITNRNDGDVIKAAVEYGKSRFKKNGRGKGLSEAKDFVMMNPAGSLYIYSGFGRYEYKTESEKEVCLPVEEFFPGTLLQWNLTLEQPHVA